MEFSPRGFQRNGARPAAPAPSLDGSAPSGGGHGNAPHQRAAAKLKGSKLLGLLVVIALVVAAALLLGLFNKSEASLVDGKRYQAVFLSNGQVYFGKIDKLTSKYIDLSDVYYLNVQDQNVQPSSSAQQNVSLVKLGCELHSPQDRMIIYREQVTFWENLKDEGQVATAVKEWKEQNPDGQKCNTQTTQQTQTTQPTTNNNSSSNNSNSTNNTTNTNNPANTNTTNTGNTNDTNDTDTTTNP